MVFSKCGSHSLQDILDSLLVQKSRGRKASGLVYNYAQQINEQCFAIDTECDDEKTMSQQRESVLRTVHAIYVSEGTIPDSVFQAAQKNYKNEMLLLNKRHLSQQERVQRKYKRMMTMGTVLGVGFVAVGLNGYMKYSALMAQNQSLSEQTQSLETVNSILHQQTETLMEQNQTLEHVNVQNQRYWGISEVAAGALGLMIEPVTATVAIIDGVRRVLGPSTPSGSG